MNKQEQLESIIRDVTLFGALLSEQSKDGLDYELINHMVDDVKQTLHSMVSIVE